MKFPLQEKIAELESRIAALEEKAKRAPATHTTTTTVRTVDLEPELGGLWKSFDALMDKAFTRRRKGQ